MASAVAITPDAVRTMVERDDRSFQPVLQVLSVKAVVTGENPRYRVRLFCTNEYNDIAAMNEMRI